MKNQEMSALKNKLLMLAKNWRKEVNDGGFVPVPQIERYSAYVAGVEDCAEELEEFVKKMEG